MKVKSLMKMVLNYLMKCIKDFGNYMKNYNLESKGE